MVVSLPRRSGVGVVEISGVIGGGVRVPVYSRLLDGLRTDRRLKAVVVEIDSPGGTATGSELLYHSLDGWRRQSRGSVHQGHRRLGAHITSAAPHQDRSPPHRPGGFDWRDISAANAAAATPETGDKLLRVQGRAVLGYVGILAQPLHPKRRVSSAGS